MTDDLGTISPFDDPDTIELRHAINEVPRMTAPHRAISASDHPEAPGCNDECGHDVCGTCRQPVDPRYPVHQPDGTPHQEYGAVLTCGSCHQGIETGVEHTCRTDSLGRPYRRPAQQLDALAARQAPTTDATCVSCLWKPDVDRQDGPAGQGRSVKAQARAHASATGHEVWAERTEATIYTAAR